VIEVRACQLILDTGIYIGIVIHLYDKGAGVNILDIQPIEAGANALAGADSGIKDMGRHRVCYNGFKPAGRDLIIRFVIVNLPMPA